MNNAILKELAPLMTARLGQSRYGSPEPQVDVLMPARNQHYRKANAALHALAAEIELATPASEKWIVQTDAKCDGGGRVYLELATDKPAEARRAIEFLGRLVS